MNDTKLYIGTALRGFCCGAFGRDAYEKKRVEALGVDWVVARDELGEIHFASGKNVHQRLIGSQHPDFLSEEDIEDMRDNEVHRHS